MKNTFTVLTFFFIPGILFSGKCAKLGYYCRENRKL